MVTIAAPTTVLIEELYPAVHIAKHTEENRRFEVYSYKGGDFFLRDTQLAIERKMKVVPARFQLPELTNTIWEHFKSASGHPMRYVMHGLGLDLDRFERYVLYAPRYRSSHQLMREQRVTCLARPEEIFFSEVERDGYKGPRFRRIG